MAGKRAWPMAPVTSHFCAQLLSRFPELSVWRRSPERVDPSRPTESFSRANSFLFFWLNVSLCSFLYLHCHRLEFAFKLIASVNVCTMFEKPEVLQFIIISFVFFLIFSPSLDHTAQTSPSVAYCLTSEQLIPVFSSVAACLTPMLLEIRCGTKES